MSLAIAGMGWVTPLGNGVDPVWKQLLQGDEATAAKISEQFGDRSYSAFRVPESVLTSLAPHPRLRRASVISRFAAAAGLEAIQAAGVKVDSQTAERIALVFAISNGGVFTRSAFTAISLKRARNQPVRFSFPKQSSTPRRAISQRFSALPAPLTLWWVIARWVSWR
jgi:3-oxoacyl-(acyl-carrier-protein) synthase